MASSCPNKILMHKSQCCCQSRGLKLQLSSSTHLRVCSRWLYAFGATTAHLKFCTDSDVMSQRVMRTNHNTLMLHDEGSSRVEQLVPGTGLCLTATNGSLQLCCCGGILLTIWDQHMPACMWIVHQSYSMDTGSTMPQSALQTVTIPPKRD